MLRNFYFGNIVLRRTKWSVATAQEINKETRNKSANTQFPAVFFTITKDILDGKLHFLCSVTYSGPMFLSYIEVNQRICKSIPVDWFQEANLTDATILKTFKMNIWFIIKTLQYISMQWQRSFSIGYSRQSKKKNGFVKINNCTKDAQVSFWKKGVLRRFGWSKKTHFEATYWPNYTARQSRGTRYTSQ